MEGQGKTTPQRRNEWLSVTAFPVVFFGLLAASAYALTTGVEAAWVVATANAVGAVAILILEKVHPYSPDWSRSRQDEPTDAMHLVVSMIALPKLLEIATFTSLYALGAALSEAIGIGLWPTQWPWWAQLLLAGAVGEFGAYQAHRAMHEHPLLWRLHATHHTVERLYWLNAARFHPLDVVLTYMAHSAPLVILGVGPEILALETVITGLHGMFQHANIHLKLGPLNHIFSMAELHRWHHSKTIADANHNYGANYILWDHVFGTRYQPNDRTPPTDIGVEDLPNFPKTWWAQVQSPWNWSDQ